MSAAGPAGRPRLRVGFGRLDISVFEPGMTMMGWGQLDNRAEGVALPLHVRAAVLDDPVAGARFAFASVELLLVSQGLWRGVVDRLAARHPELGLGAHNVAITATHTHSGPSGYAHHFWVNLNAPGFSRPVYEALVDRVTAAIVEAVDRARPATARVVTQRVPLSEGIAFNRSWRAYNRNVDVAPVTEARRDEATERMMTLLRFDGEDGRPFGAIHWLGLHGTCVHADNRRLHPDHKGVVAMALEADGLDVVCAQACCGDVSPNYRWDPRRGHTVGRYDDDLESAIHVGEVQARWARRALRASDGPRPGVGAAAFETRGDGGDSAGLAVAARWIDFSSAPADGRWTVDGRARRTSPARLGVSMARGTAEGPGPLRRHGWLTALLNGGRGRADRLRGVLSRRAGAGDDPKFPLLELGRGLDGRLAGLIPLRSGRVPGIDPVFAWVGRQIREGRVAEGPWIPQRLPIHLARLGTLAILAVPFEMTTVAGRRLRRTVRAALPEVEHVVITPYSNAYCGYLTTFEEYQVQHYEAAYTLFGPHTLAALRTGTEALAAQLSGARAGAMPGPEAARIALEALAPIAFQGPWPG